jgi:hypothetical protein
MPEIGELNAGRGEEHELIRIVSPPRRGHEGVVLDRPAEPDRGRRESGSRTGSSTT